MSPTQNSVISAANRFVPAGRRTGQQTAEQPAEDQRESYVKHIWSQRKRNQYQRNLAAKHAFYARLGMGHIGNHPGPEAA